jgi:LAO/AO transport system kinase
MASRGSLGGLASATAAMVQVFDAAGFEVILVETVGAGQTEVDIARLAHTTLVVEAPGLGDEIQAIKAGILEIADILVINKADLPGMESTERALKGMLMLAYPVEKVFQHHEQSIFKPEKRADTSTLWQAPILRTIATDGSGVADLMAAIEQHAQYLHQNGGWERRERARLEAELDNRLTESLVTHFRTSIPDGRYEEIVDQLVDRSLSPWEAVKVLLK